MSLNISHSPFSTVVTSRPPRSRLTSLLGSGEVDDADSRAPAAAGAASAAVVAAAADVAAAAATTPGGGGGVRSAGVFMNE